MGMNYTYKAQKAGMRAERSLARSNTCTCHPRQWGLKKGLRRARRRLDRQLTRGLEDLVEKSDD